jgi:hypothetical protein
VQGRNIYTIISSTRYPTTIGSSKGARGLKPWISTHFRVWGLEWQGIFELLHRELMVRKILKSRTLISLFQSSSFGAARDFGVAGSRTPGSLNPEILRSNLSISEFRVWSGKGFWSHCIVNSWFKKSH